MNNSSDQVDGPLCMQLELENVQSVIKLTKENIDALNDRFSKFQPSPRIYLEEYNDLTSKLHQLKRMEQNYIEKMQLIQDKNKVGRARFVCEKCLNLAILFRRTVTLRLKR